MYEYFEGRFIYGDDIYVPNDYMDEKWWYIDDAPGYMISNYGRVWSKKRQSFIKPKPMDRHGHLGVCLCVDGQRIYRYIHRLMAKAFISNEKHYPIVRHLNDIPSDNAIENLQWGTQKDNARDSINNGNAHFITEIEREIGLSKMRIPVRAINIKTGEEIIFRGQTEASRILGVQQSNIWKVLRGERVHAGGYYFEYVDKGDYND